VLKSNIQLQKKANTLVISITRHRYLPHIKANKIPLSIDSKFYIVKPAISFVFRRNYITFT